MNYFNKHIKNLHSISAPLSKLTSSKRVFCFEEEQKIAFNSLKQLLLEAPILGFPNYNERFYLNCDASGHAVEGVLDARVHIKTSSHCILIKGFKCFSEKLVYDWSGVFCNIFLSPTYGKVYGLKFTCFNTHGSSALKDFHN